MKINVTIAIPAYNSAKTIRESIESALAQDYPLKEVLVVDDCSTDDTVKIANEYPVRVVKNVFNFGIGRNLVKCMEEAKGKYVVFLCSDDIFAEKEVVGDVARIFNTHSKIGMISRYFYQFLNGYAGAVMTIREKNIMLASICPSGMAFRNIGNIAWDNTIFLEMPSIVKQYLKSWEWTTMEYDTVAARLHPGGNTGTFSSYYNDSPIRVLTSFYGKDFKYHLGLIQLKNRAPKLLPREIYLTAKINPANLADPFFWFCAAVAFFVPGSILRRMSDFYRHRINRENCKIIKRPSYYRGGIQ